MTAARNRNRIRNRNKTKRNNNNKDMNRNKNTSTNKNVDSKRIRGSDLRPANPKLNHKKLCSWKFCSEVKTRK